MSGADKCQSRVSSSIFQENILTTRMNSLESRCNRIRNHGSPASNCQVHRAKQPHVNESFGVRREIFPCLTLPYIFVLRCGRFSPQNCHVRLAASFPSTISHPPIRESENLDLEDPCCGFQKHFLCNRIVTMYVCV